MGLLLLEEGCAREEVREDEEEEEEEEGTEEEEREVSEKSAAVEPFVANGDGLAEEVEEEEDPAGKETLRVRPSLASAVLETGVAVGGASLENLLATAPQIEAIPRSKRSLVFKSSEMTSIFPCIRTMRRPCSSSSTKVLLAVTVVSSKVRKLCTVSACASLRAFFRSSSVSNIDLGVAAGLAAGGGGETEGDEDGIQSDRRKQKR